jgi:hypothetical protein
LLANGASVEELDRRLDFFAEDLSENRHVGSTER